VVIDVVIYQSGCCEGSKKAPASGSTNLPGPEAMARAIACVFACSLQQSEFLSAADGRPTVVHPELVVDGFGVGTHGVQGHH